jgi:hypothetical protein
MIRIRTTKSFSIHSWAGTTVVEALRLGCRVIGIDLNPVAWFIVKTETQPVELDVLKAAFDGHFCYRRSISHQGSSLTVRVGGSGCPFVRMAQSSRLSEMK